MRQIKDIFIAIFLGIEGPQQWFRVLRTVALGLFLFRYMTYPVEELTWVHPSWSKGGIGQPLVVLFTELHRFSELSLDYYLLLFLRLLTVGVLALSLFAPTYRRLLLSLGLVFCLEVISRAYVGYFFHQYVTAFYALALVTWLQREMQFGRDRFVLGRQVFIFIIALYYVSAGTCKLLVGGIDWMTTDHLAMTSLGSAMRQSLSMEPWPTYHLLGVSWFWIVTALGTVVIELSAVFLPFSVWALGF